MAREQFYRISTKNCLYLVLISPLSQFNGYLTSVFLPIRLTELEVSMQSLNMILRNELSFVDADTVLSEEE